jgi:DNA-binding transcriptional LysR family regulator
MMNIRQIESFYWIATLGSFSAAAKRLFITQSAISSRILALEQDLGASLFERGGRKLKLTARGSELFESARKLLDLVADIQGSATGERKIRGTVRLGVVNTIAHTWLPRLVQELDRKHPMVDVDLQVGVSSSLENMLSSHDLDLVISVRRITGRGMKCEFLCRYPVAWVASTSLSLPKEPLRLAELARHRLMTYERGAVLYQATTDLFRRRGIWPLRLSGSNSVAAMVEIALKGVGICAVPAPVVASHIASGQLRILRTEAALPDVDFFIAYPTQPFNELAAAVAETALAICRDPKVQHPPIPRERPGPVRSRHNKLSVAPQRRTRINPL